MAKKWIADVRTGIVAVYWAEKSKNCLSGCSGWSVFVRCGEYNKEKHYWAHPKRYDYQARFLAWILNLFKCEYRLSDVRDE